MGLRKVVLFFWIALPLMAQDSIGRAAVRLFPNQEQTGVTADEISEILVDVDSDSLSSYIAALQAFGTRLTIVENRFAVAQWIADKFLQLGYSQVECDTFEAHIAHSSNWYQVDSAYSQVNVICTLPGTGAPEEVFILCAHYDSFNSANNPLLFAPGADDNASGVAALLEIARVLKKNGYEPKRTLQFVALAGEELMARSDSGSKYYASKLASNQVDVRLVVNHDMIGFTDKDLGQSQVAINRPTTAEHYAELGVQSAEKYTSITAVHSSYSGADLGPFVAVGYYGIYFEEAVFSPYYHSTQDILAHVDCAFCREVVKTSAATVLWAMSMPNMVTGIQSELVSQPGPGIAFSWHPNTDFDFDHYLLYLSKNDGAGFEAIATGDTSVVIYDVPNFETVKYAVAAVSHDGWESFAEIFDFKETTSVREQGGVVSSPELIQNYPNPFNPSTQIRYRVVEASDVEITIFNSVGQTVKTWRFEAQSPGGHTVEWNGVDARGNRVSSGLYLCRMATEDYVGVKKMVFMR